VTKPGFVCWVSFMSVLMVGCSHPTPGNSSTTAAPVTASATTGPTKPAVTADENTWGNYLSEQGKLHGKDVSMSPNIYVIPNGDNLEAVARRQNESDSIVSSIGHTLLPGGLLIIGGSDSHQTSNFVTDVCKQIKLDTLKGIVVMIVADNAQKNPVSSALKPTGAAVRFVTM
jgi:hypothetical protein